LIHKNESWPESVGEFLTTWMLLTLSRQRLCVDARQCSVTPCNSFYERTDEAYSCWWLGVVFSRSQSLGLLQFKTKKDLSIFSCDRNWQILSIFVQYSQYKKFPLVKYIRRSCWWWFDVNISTFHASKLRTICTFSFPVTLTFDLLISKHITIYRSAGTTATRSINFLRTSSSECQQCRSRRRKETKTNRKQCAYCFLLKNAIIMTMNEHEGQFCYSKPL